MDRLVTLDNFERALRNARADGAEFMVIGGLGVGYWAKRFDVFDRPGEIIYSKDIGLRGNKAAASLVAARLREEGHVINTLVNVFRREPPGLGMNYVVQLELKDIGRTSVEVLEKMPLVDSPELPPQGFAVETDGIPVLDPMSLLIGKIHAWNNRPAGQSDNDARHIELLRRLLPAFMEEARGRGLGEEIRTRAEALLAVLDQWRTPLVPADIAELRRVLVRQCSPS